MLDTRSAHRLGNHGQSRLCSQQYSHTICISYWKYEHVHHQRWYVGLIYKQTFS